MSIDNSTPVLLLGGQENALAVARNLGRRGIAVRVSGGATCWGMHSRYCRESFPVPNERDPETFWHHLLLSPGRDALKGHMVLACSDEAVEFLANHEKALRERYLLDDFVAEQALAMLDKRKTLELARSVGVPTPNFWIIESDQQLEGIRDAVKFPVMVKPIHSHRFVPIFGQKLFIVESGFDEVAEKVRLAREHQIDVMVVEMIPGPDDLLCSFFTYRDRSGRHLFRFTKRILRRYPVNRGGACYHITEWLPETAALGEKFFDGIDFLGIGNIEFKRDVRDGKLKIIEVNTRFVAPHELLVRCGAPLDLVVYCHLTGQPLPDIQGYEQFRRLWNPVKDFFAFRELNRRGDLTFLDWVRGLPVRRSNFPIFSANDPVPAASSLVEMFRQARRSQ